MAGLLKKYERVKMLNFIKFHKVLPVQKRKTVTFMETVLRNKRRANPIANNKRKEWASKSLRETY